MIKGSISTYSMVNFIDEFLDDSYLIIENDHFVAFANNQSDRILLASTWRNSIDLHLPTFGNLTKINILIHIRDVNFAITELKIMDLNLKKESFDIDLIREELRSESFNSSNSSTLNSFLNEDSPDPSEFRSFLTDFSGWINQMNDLIIKDAIQSNSI